MILRLNIVIALLVSAMPMHAEIGIKKIAEGFQRPVWVETPKGIHGKLWVVEQTGKIWIVDELTGNRENIPFLDITHEISRKGNEEGLLGLAFEPNFQSSGRYYVNFTDNHKQTRIVRYTSTNQKTTDASKGEVIMKYPSEFENHNGGWLGFGPDNMLYIGNGDGGSGNDPNQRGQALDTLLGKILRIDVSSKTSYKIPKDNPFLSNQNAKPEIWAYGVRNPWRCSFDRKTGDFWIGDVGQNAWEEINFSPNGKSSGANYGWRLREGLIATPTINVGGKTSSNTIDPVYVYRHGANTNEGLSVTGGYVYRGSIKELQGRYIFGDYQNSRIWSFKLDQGRAIDFIDHTKKLQPQGGRINLIASFAENSSGEIMIIDHTGFVYRIINQ